MFEPILKANTQLDEWAQREVFTNNTRQIFQDLFVENIFGGRWDYAHPHICAWSLITCWTKTMYLLPYSKFDMDIFPIYWLLMHMWYVVFEDELIKLHLF